MCVYVYVRVCVCEENQAKARLEAAEARRSSAGRMSSIDKLLVQGECVLLVLRVRTDFGAVHQLE